MIVHDADLAEEVRMTTVHGQNVKYHHQIIGCNSRLDTLQAAILNAKLKHIDDFIASRQAAARRYDRCCPRGCSQAPLRSWRAGVRP